MREILFRGKRVDNDEWVEGELLHDMKGRAWIYWTTPKELPIFFLRSAIVKSETVGQFTGLTDKNGAKIFEGDIMVAKGATRPFMIAWDGLGWKMYMYDGKRIKYAYECNDIRYMRSSEVIGNKWDNSELLEVKK